MILDTEFLISLRAEEPPSVELARDLEDAGVPLRIPTIVVEELYVGVGAGSTPDENVRSFEALLANKPVVPLDLEIARRAGVIEGVHLSSDTKPALGPADAIVAATGLALDEAVVTNDGDFEHVDGLRVELY